MPAKMFSEHQDRLAYEIYGGDRTKFSTEDRILAKQFVNRAREIIYEFANWTWSRQRGYIITTADYDDETVTLTADSTAVTGQSTVFTAAMVGRYLIYGGVAYKIRKFTSTTALILEVPFTGSTAEEVSYSICEPEYILPYYVREVSKDSVKLIGQDKGMKFKSESEFATDYGNPSSIDDPPVIYRHPEYTTSAFYSTGTVTTDGTVDVVGSGTSWDHTMIGRAFRIASTSIVYRIADVTSTTALSLDRAYGGSDAAAQSYEIDPGPCLKIWFYPFFTKSRGIEFWYWTKADRLINDADIDRLMPGDFHEYVDQGTEWLWYDYEKSGDQNASAGQEKFISWLGTQRKKLRITQNRRVGRKPHPDYVRRYR